MTDWLSLFNHDRLVDPEKAIIVCTALSALITTINHGTCHATVWWESALTFVMEPCVPARRMLQSGKGRSEFRDFELVRTCRSYQKFIATDAGSGTEVVQQS
eukprot:scaffold2993_cov154-Cylindrotheca_fusiformis.AAC.3